MAETELLSFFVKLDGPSGPMWGGGGGENCSKREASTGSVPSPGSSCDAPRIWQIDVN